jgi:hypothetical protein
MHVRLLRLFAAVFFILPGFIQAQVSVKGRPASLSATERAQLPTVITAPVDRAALLAEDELDEANGIPLRFGKPFEVHYSLDNSGVWETNADGSRVWRLEIESPGAYSINLVYSDFFLPQGGRFFVYDPDRFHVLGAFTEKNNKSHGKFATAPVPGEVCILEYQEPPGTRGEARITVQRIVHAYRDLFAMATEKTDVGFGESGPCNVNINCPEGADWGDDKRAVAMILTQGGFRICTGSLVNNAREDKTPFFLTANHCLGDEETWIFMFNYESPGCESIDGPTWMTTSGSTLLATNTYSDFALLELSESPPDSFNVYYAGWSATGDTLEGATVIHHPMGDVKKISFDYDEIVPSAFMEVPGTGESHWRIASWDIGTTEPGSSGSSLFDTAHHIVGQLHGGYASCNNTSSDWFGRLSESWTYGFDPSMQLRYWLDADRTGILTLDGRDWSALTIYHVPLEDTREIVQDYEVAATIVTGCGPGFDSLMLSYVVRDTLYTLPLEPSGEANEFHQFIPVQPVSTTVRYWLEAWDGCGNDTKSDTVEFSVLDNGVLVTPKFSGKSARVDSTVFYIMQVTNTGVSPNTYLLSVSGNTWQTELFDVSGSMPIMETGVLGSGATFSFKAAVQIGESIYGDTDMAVVEARALSDTAVFDYGTVWTMSKGQPMTMPFAESFTDTVLDRRLWTICSEAKIDTLGLNEPSPPYSMNLNGEPHGVDTLISQVADLSEEVSLVLSYWYQRGGGGEPPDAGDDLIVEYKSATGIWRLLKRYEGGDTTMHEFVQDAVALPSGAYHQNFQFRFRSFGDIGAFDDWFIDDVTIDYAPVIGVNPGVFSATLHPGESSVQSFVVSNSGLAELSYQVESVPGWLGISKTLGALAPGAQDTVTFSVSWEDLDTGLVTDTVLFESNDPVGSRNPLAVPLELQVRPYFCGDVDNDGRGPNLADITRLIAYVYLKGDEPVYPEAANVDGDELGKLNLADITTLIGYVYLHTATLKCR